jgi:CheY-like chemotaxis protein
MQQAQKLESLGVLAGGIAHDFNNLLMGVLGNASLALLELPAGSPIRRNLEQIERAGQRAADLSKQMLAYSGKGRYIVQPIRISTLVDDMVHLLKVSISKKAEMVYELDADMPMIEGDPTQLGQVVLNLITNASEAIGENPGTITVRTGATDLSKADVAEAYLKDGLEDGRYAFLEVSDTGAGMDGETVERIFDPFYSTKFTGRGLGLAAVMGIVRGHEGTIQVQSEVGKGCTLRVLFPCVEAEAAAEPEPAVFQGPWHAEGTVLVVDDEESVLDVAQQVLEECGFSVLLAHDGKEGVEVFRAHADEIALVLLDLTMPRMSGEEAFEEMRRIQANALVLLSSGYDESEAATRFAGKGLAGFIQKPYRVQDLVHAVRGVLEGSPA